MYRNYAAMALSMAAARLFQFAATGFRFGEYCIIKLGVRLVYRPVQLLEFQLRYTVGKYHDQLRVSG